MKVPGRPWLSVVSRVAGARARRSRGRLRRQPAGGRRDDLRGLRLRLQRLSQLAVGGRHAVPEPPARRRGGVGPDGGATDGGVHPVPETEYWKIPSPITGNEFPLRTIIVKETNEADPTARQVFALVKRGGDFNPTGAVNWEWFELKNNADGSVVIGWQGYGPPSGSADIYGGNPAVCNTCHIKAAANDYVWSAALQLSNL